MAPPLRVEPECPLDEGTEWIVGRIGGPNVFCGLRNRRFMDSQTHGLADSRTHRLADSYRKYLQLEYFAGTLQCVSPRICESAEYIRPNRWASLYLDLHRMSLCPSLDIRTVLASNGVKIVREHSMAPTGWFGGAYASLRPPLSTATVLWSEYRRCPGITGHTAQASRGSLGV